MGIYCINRSVIEALPRGAKYGFDNLMIDRLANKQSIDIRPFSGYWLDIGRPDDYQYADEHFDELSSKLGINLK
jgi:NDP-sugar pyrophosphorylase family protein